MEDMQPNEVRHANTPRVRITRPVHAPYRPPKRSRPLPNRASAHERVKVHLPRECHKGEPGSHIARKRWIEDQKYRLYTDRRLSVVSFRYLDRDNSVLFDCRIQRATQSSGYYARDGLEIGSALANTHPGTERVRQSNLVQNSESGPSRIGLTSRAFGGLDGCPQRLSNSSYSIESRPIKSSMTKTKAHPVGIVHTNPVPRHRTSIHTTSPTETVVDLTLNHPALAAKEQSPRWSNFRSGYMNISLPPFNRGSSPDASTDQQVSIDQIQAQVVVQREDMPVIWNSDTNPQSVQSNIYANNAIHRIRGSVSDQLRQHDVIEVTRSSHPHSVVLEDEATPSPPDHSLLIRNFNSTCGKLLLSLGSHDRPRRILHDRDSTFVVTAHGIINQVDIASVLKSDRNIRSPALPFEESVDDACVLPHQGDLFMILGHAREQNQITLLSLGHGQVSRHITLRRAWNTMKRPGVSAITSLMSPLKFVSGGYDHRVHLWNIARDLSGASAVELAIKHASLVHSLLPIVDTSHKLVSVGADRDVPIYDLSAERVVHTLKTSCIPYHAHRTDTPSCTLLEVSHLETQFEIRDHRMPSQAVQRFGFLAKERRGRFEKADSWSHFVVCGDRNGAVHLWDLRNLSTEITCLQCFNNPVVQVVNTGPRLLACSKKNELVWISLHGE